MAEVMACGSIGTPDAGADVGRGRSRRQHAGAPSRSPSSAPASVRRSCLYVTGRSTIEVGEAMDVKYETAKTYLRRVREKYQKVGRPASRKTDLIRRAAEDGFLE